MKSIVQDRVTVKGRLMMKKYNKWDTIETVLMIVFFMIYAPVKICMDLARLNCKGGKFLR